MRKQATQRAHARVEHGPLFGLPPLAAEDCWVSLGQLAAVSGLSLRALASYQGRRETARNPMPATRTVPGCKLHFISAREAENWLDKLGITVDWSQLERGGD